MKGSVVAALAVCFPVSAFADELPLSKITLSTSGLAQFTHQGQVNGPSTMTLQVRLDQVDDLLKSLTVYDKQGSIGAVTLPGKSPLEELFRDLPFGQDALASPSALLNALVGTQVEIEGEVNAKGKVFRADEETVRLQNGGGEVVKHRLTILTEKGFVQAIVENLSAIRFTEPLAKEQIERALSGLAQNRTKERRTLSIQLTGEGTRHAGYSYVVPAPVWKTSYRLVLPKEGGKAHLQAWGVIENLTGSDWKNVDLSLMSGNPVALHQSLYSAFYASRPDIPVSTTVPVVPKTDDAEEQKPRAFAFDGALKSRTGFTPGQPVPAPKALQQPNQSLTRAYNYQEASGGSQSLVNNAPQDETLATPETGAEAEEAATQILYRFPAKVSLPSGSTMMVPFADREITASRTFLYQPETNTRRPLAAVKLTNDSDTALPAGIITAFDTGNDGATTFVGDAQLPLTAKGGAKFVTFALDSKTDIRRTDAGVRKTRLGTFANGQMTLMTKSRWNIAYEITPPAEEDRDIVIDEARIANWKIPADAKDVEETAGRTRLKVFAPRGKTTKAVLARELTEKQTITLTSLDPDYVLATISGLDNENGALKEAIAKLGELVDGLAKAKARRAELESERKKINDDQDRIRKNLTSVGPSSDLGRRYLDSLRAQEDRLAAIATEDKTIEADTAAKRKAVGDIVKNLTL